ncbi:MAG: response regulator [Synechococcales cyanobacterium M58_A2018_015]|nr:response regulator [Synechococcales cyanobacterium M58_A2018_015]
MSIPVSYQFSFAAQELPQKLTQISQAALTGYWHCEFLLSPLGKQSWYLTLSQGRVLFSGNQPLSWSTLLTILQRYVPGLRHEPAVHILRSWEQRFLIASQEEQLALLADLVNELQESEFMTADDLVRSLRLHILTEFDTYLFSSSGEAQFLPSPQLASHAFIVGFAVDDLIREAAQRQIWWQRLNAQIPSMNCVPVLNPAAVQGSLTVHQQQRLEALVASGRTLNDIAVAVAQDPLDIAKVFAKLVSEALVSLQDPRSTTAPEILFIDDSPLLLRQFKSLVSSWGYLVHAFQNPVLAMKALMDLHPAVIFLDINMPGMTGFDLVKQIRRRPELEAIPLIMLTAEKSLSNNWRARWSGCRFLTKPLTPDEVPQFQIELRMLLMELAPLTSQVSVGSVSTYSSSHSSKPQHSF